MTMGELTPEIYANLTNGGTTQPRIKINYLQETVTMSNESPDDDHTMEELIRYLKNVTAFKNSPAFLTTESGVLIKYLEGETAFEKSSSPLSNDPGIVNTPGEEKGLIFYHRLGLMLRY